LVCPIVKENKIVLGFGGQLQLFFLSPTGFVIVSMHRLGVIIKGMREVKKKKKKKKLVTMRKIKKKQICHLSQ
jgi:hypothetical protein